MQLEGKKKFVTKVSDEHIEIILKLFVEDGYGYNGIAKKMKEEFGAQKERGISRPTIRRIIEYYVEKK